MELTIRYSDEADSDYLQSTLHGLFGCVVEMTLTDGYTLDVIPTSFGDTMLGDAVVMNYEVWSPESGEPTKWGQQDVGDIAHLLYL